MTTASACNGANIKAVVKKSRCTHRHRSFPARRWLRVINMTASSNDGVTPRVHSRTPAPGAMFYHRGATGVDCDCGALISLGVAHIGRKDNHLPAGFPPADQIQQKTSDDYAARAERWMVPPLSPFTILDIGAPLPGWLFFLTRFLYRRSISILRRSSQAPPMSGCGMLYEIL